MPSTLTAEQRVYDPFQFMVCETGSGDITIFVKFNIRNANSDREAAPILNVNRCSWDNRNFCEVEISIYPVGLESTTPRLPAGALCELAVDNYYFSWVANIDEERKSRT